MSLVPLAISELKRRGNSSSRDHGYEKAFATLNRTQETAGTVCVHIHTRAEVQAMFGGTCQKSQHSRGRKTVCLRVYRESVSQKYIMA